MMLNKNIVKYVFVLSLVLFSSEMLFAQKYSVKRGSTFFKAKMPLNSYEGKSEQLQGSIDFQTGQLEFKVPVISIKTGVSRRDKDMYELLNEAKNPEVTFKGKLMGDYDFKNNSKQTLKIQGDFTLAGTSREVIIDIDLAREGNGLLLTAAWSLLITDYNLKRPTKVFLKVDDKHELEINALLVKE